MQTVTVTIDPATGETLVEVDGVAGKACENLTRELERDLGTVTGRKRKPEYHRKAVRNAEHKR